jgi:uroporphyrinogen-III decarboxylase
MRSAGTRPRRRGGWTQLEHVLSHIPLGVSFESIGPDADIRQIREATKGKQAISGNLDPLKVLWQGNPESIAAEVQRIMGICKEGGGFIFNSGEMNPREIPEENMMAFMETAQKLLSRLQIRPCRILLGPVPVLCKRCFT